MANALNISNLVNVQVQLGALAAQGQNLNTLCILGDSAVIPPNERIHFYGSISDVAGEFATTTPEYKAALLYFAQIPQPASLAIARWATNAYSAILIGGSTTSNLTDYLNLLKTVTNGAFSLVVNGGTVNVANINLSTASSLTQVAQILDTQLGTLGCIWDANNNRFLVTSNIAGVNSTITFATDTGPSTLATLLKITQATGTAVYNGGNAETVTAAVQNLFTNFGNQFFGLTIAATTTVTDVDNYNIASIAQADQQHIFGITSSASNILDASVTNDIASQLRLGSIAYAFVQYSTSSPYAAASFFGRALTVNYGGQNTLITLMYKQEPLILPENITQTQANTLQAKNCNVLVSYATNPTTAILQFGTCGSDYFDTIAGLVWLKNQVQLDLYNVLYTTPTKIPQTDAGVGILLATVSGTCAQGVNNGLIAGGTWNAPGFGDLTQGEYLQTGFYVYAEPIANQTQADRESRQSPPIMVAVKLAGAIHTVDVIITVNR